MEENTNIEHAIDEQTESDFTFNSIGTESTVNGHNVQHKKETDKKNLLSSCWHKFRSVLSNLYKQVASTYSKRNPAVNAILTIILLISFFVSGPLFLALSISKLWFIGIPYILYFILYAYYLSKFILINRKDAIIPALFCSITIWLPILFLYAIFSVPEHVFLDEDGNEINGLFIYIPILLFSFLLNAVLFSILYLTMKIKKYGASAWSLLDIPRGKRHKIDICCIIVSSILWILPIVLITCASFM